MLVLNKFRSSRQFKDFIETQFQQRTQYRFNRRVGTKLRVNCRSRQGNVIFILPNVIKAIGYRCFGMIGTVADAFAAIDAACFRNLRFAATNANRLSRTPFDAIDATFAAITNQSYGVEIFFQGFTPHNSMVLCRLLHTAQRLRSIFYRNGLSVRRKKPIPLSAAGTFNRFAMLCHISVIRSLTAASAISSTVFPDWTAVRRVSL